MRDKVLPATGSPCRSATQAVGRDPSCGGDNALLDAKPVKLLQDPMVGLMNA